MFLGKRAWPECKADNLTAICKPIVYTMWDLHPPTTLQASTTFYGNNFTFSIIKM
jgi:hypothetical protein